MIRIDNAKNPPGILWLPLLILPAVGKEGEPGYVEARQLEAVRLIPAGNNVSAEYVDALRQSRHAKHFAEMQTDRDGAGPWLVVHDPVKSADLVRSPEGPPPPATLAQYTDVRVCEALIEHTADKEALTRWLKDRRPEVVAAVRARLATL